MAGVEHGQRVAAGQRAVAGQIIREVRTPCFGGIEFEETRGRGIETDQVGIRQCSGRNSRIKCLRQAREMVVEDEGIECLHEWNITGVLDKDY